MASEIEYERWRHWAINWSAVVTGALTAIAVSILFGLIGVAIGAYQLTPEGRVVDVHKVTTIAMVLAVIGSFFSFVAGGWVVGKIAGILHSEPAMLHGAIVWLAVVPLLAIFSVVGVGGYAGSWYSGLSPMVVADEMPSALGSRPVLAFNATELERARYDAELAEYQRRLVRWHADAPIVARNSALLAITALIISLLGAVLGGWMSSGEPMSWTYKRKAIAPRESMNI